MTAARMGYEGRVSAIGCSVGSTDRCSSSRIAAANAAVVVAVAGVVVLVGIVDW